MTFHNKPSRIQTSKIVATINGNETRSRRNFREKNRRFLIDSFQPKPGPFHHFTFLLIAMRINLNFTTKYVVNDKCVRGDNWDTYESNDE